MDCANLERPRRVFEPQEAAHSHIWTAGSENRGDKRKARSSVRALQSAAHIPNTARRVGLSWMNARSNRRAQ